MIIYTCGKHNYSGIDMSCPDCKSAPAIYPETGDVKKKVRRKMLKANELMMTILNPLNNFVEYTFEIVNQKRNKSYIITEVWGADRDNKTIILEMIEKKK